MDHVLLATAYFPSVFYISRIIQTSGVIIEKEENFQKQTYRNRCVILGANGPLSLTVPVQHEAPKIRIADLKISYHNHWQLIHFRAVESAYRNSPFYEYYMDDFQKFFQNKYDSLLEFNTQILQTCLVLIGYKGKPGFTEDYIYQESVNDYRYKISPKQKITDYEFPEYHQVFQGKFGFVPDLSVLDLIFNVGPESMEYLRNIRKKNGQE